MSSAKSEKAANGEETRASILRAALDLLSTEGHEALTVRRVATAAGCSTIGVYTWFGGKDGLIDAILVEGFTSFAAALRAARPSRGPLARAHAQAKVYRRWALAHPMHYQVMFLKAIPGHVPCDAAAIAGADAYGALLEAVTDAHRKGELVTKDLDAVALSMWALVHGHVSLQIANERPPQAVGKVNLDDRAFDLALRTMVRGLSVANVAHEGPARKQLARPLLESAVRRTGLGIRARE